jgi:hypothetical protein
VVNPKGVRLILNADAHPDVGLPRQLRAQAQEPLRALRQHLVAVVARPVHHAEDFVYVLGVS